MSESPRDGDVATAGHQVETLISPRSIPPFHLWLFRVGFVVVLAAYYGLFFVAVRSLQGHFGFSPWYSLAALAPTAVMTLFVLPLAVFSQLPERWILHHLPAQRSRRGLCPECGYRIAATNGACPECGAIRAPRPMIEFSSSSFRTFAWLALLGFLLGGALGETFVQIDEWRFREEVRRALDRDPLAPVERRREWPGNFATLTWTAERGFESSRLSRPAPAAR